MSFQYASVSECSDDYETTLKLKLPVLPSVTDILIVEIKHQIMLKIKQSIFDLKHIAYLENIGNHLN